jgi:hypothetical protein
MLVVWTGTGNMVADGLTKALSRNKFDGFVQKVGLCRSGRVNPDHGWTLVLFKMLSLTTK